MKIYLLGGENTYKSEIELHNTINTYTQDGVGLKNYYADELAKLTDITGLAGEMSFDYITSIIVIRNLISTGDLKLLTEFYEFITTETADVVLVLYENKAIDHRSKIYKYCFKLNSVKEFAESTLSEKKDFIENYLKKNHLIAAVDIIQELETKLVSFNLNIISNELEKIRELLRYDKRKALTTIDLEIINQDLSEEIWKLFELGVMDKPKAFLLLENLFIHETNFNLIVGYLGQQLRNLFYYYYYPTKLNYYANSRLDKIKSKINKTKLNLLVAKLFDLDLALKTTALSPKTALVLYLTLL